MSNPTPEILPYATPEGIKQYVPLQQHISVCAERDVLRHEVKHLRQAVAELNERGELQKDVSALLRALDAHDVAEGVNTAMHLREAVAELNERMTTEVTSYMASMEALRAENRRLEKELSATRDQA